MIQYKLPKDTIIWLATLITLLAVVTRFFMLDEKPIHFDEGINGWFSMQIHTSGYYKYDPQNYHGPLYFYLLNWSEQVFGQSLAVLRLVPSLFGIASIVLFAGAGVRLSKTYIVIALALLLSPAFIFFSRSGIHEIPFVFFQLVLGLGVSLWLKSQSRQSLLTMILGLWGMALLKETFAITVVAGSTAILLMGPGFWKAQVLSVSWRTYLDKTFWKFLGSLLVLFFLFYTGFLKNLQGAADFFKAFMPWLKTGAHGNGHEKEFLYWFKIFITAEPLVCLAVILAIWGVVQKSSSELRFWSLFSLIQFLIYSLIPYKTVWCVVSIIWPFYFVLHESFKKGMEKSLLATRAGSAMAAALILLGFQSVYRSSYSQPLDLTHPFIYVNSTYTVKEIQAYLDSNLAKNPETKDLLLQVGMPEQWPWPFILRNYANVNYGLCAKELLPSAALYFCEIPESDNIEILFEEPYWKITSVLRQTRPASVLYFKKSVFPDRPIETAVLIEPLEK